MIENYEGLTAGEKANVLDIFFKNSKDNLVITKPNNNETTTKKEPVQKNNRGV